MDPKLLMRDGHSSMRNTGMEKTEEESCNDPGSPDGRKPEKAGGHLSPATRAKAKRQEIGSDPTPLADQHLV
ncbi:hypothetical protein NFI96_010118 [Prochilodus magdalenae]|nr:hypothetical protein NFI96_010118 [Prochilodus magdalenae]